jgi:hypothetical protein
VEFPNKDFEDSYWAKQARIAGGHDGSLAMGATVKDAKPVPPVPAKHIGPPTIVAARSQSDSAVVAYAVEYWERADGTWFYRTLPLGEGDTESRVPV